MTIKTIEAKLDAIADKLDRLIEKLNNRRYEDEIQAQAARIRYLQNELNSRDDNLEITRRTLGMYLRDQEE